MRVKILVLLLLCWSATSMFGVILQQTETSEDNGIIVISREVDSSFSHIFEGESISRDDRVGTAWEVSDSVGICGNAKVSADLQTTFVNWTTNNQRIALYQNTDTPIWSYTAIEDFSDIGMSGDGSILAAGENMTLKLFNNESATPIWEIVLSRSIVGIELSVSGDLVYIASYNTAQDYTYLECYSVGNAIPLWTLPYSGPFATLTSCDDGSKIILTQYGGECEDMWVIDSGNGELLFHGPAYNQNPPDMSSNGEVIVNGDYSGYVYLYTWDEQLLTYNEQWRYHVGGGGSSAWIGGMAVSSDGSTVAVGTLVFLSTGFDGEVYLFDVASPTPLWVYEHAGDYVIDIDMNSDGSLIAAASWGPLDHSTPDFMLFRRESNVPAFEINTLGSLDFVDMAEDGSFCATGGKAVHEREMGWGGMLYNIDCDLGGGFIVGTVDLVGSDDNSGVKVSVNGLVDYYGITDESGAFFIGNVPADAYMLEYNKTGYISTAQVVIVVEGETVSAEDQILDSWGEAPQNLSASQAAGIGLELNWTAPTTITVEGYNVYRKQYASDTFPEEPLATISSETCYYVDETAFPEREYYYVVTAKVMTQFQTPYSNEAIGWISTGFIANDISAYYGTTPTIDGVMSAGEWDDAFMIDCSDFCGAYDNTSQPIGSVMGYYKTNSEMTELYVAYINMNDNMLDDHDEVALYIDDNNDGVYPDAGDDSEGNYWAAYYAAGNELKYRPIYNSGGVGTVEYLDNPQLGVSDSEGYLVYEFIIPMGSETWEISPNAENQSSLAIFVLDDNAPDTSDFDGWWPFQNTDLFSPEGYGTISYGTTAQTPEPPSNLNYSIIGTNLETLHLTWDMPAMNDFDHFNIFCAVNDGTPELMGNVLGTVFDYQIDSSPNTQYTFYVTTVNHSNMESAPSESVEYNSTYVDNQEVPVITALNGNYPNPFNPTTRIEYSLQNDCQVELQIYNMRGQLVRTLVKSTQSAGTHTAMWNGSDNTNKQVASGIYFYKMKTDEFEETRKMLMLK